MFERPHHQRIAKLLTIFDSDLLQQAECYFGGGTAIVLLLGEYREAGGVDFLCSSTAGNRLLRNLVDDDLGALLKSPVDTVRELRAGRDAMWTVIRLNEAVIKVQIIKEGNLALQGGFNASLGVPTLSMVDMFATKLLANADRGLDKGTSSLDMIDLAMMVEHWGDIPDAAWKKAYDAYGPVVYRGFLKAVEQIRDRNYLSHCLRTMHMDERLLTRLPEILADTSAQIKRRLTDPAEGLGTAPSSGVHHP